MHLEIEVPLNNLKNQSNEIEVKLGPNHSTCHPDFNGVNDTQIGICMLKIFMVKFLVKLGQVIVTNEATI